MTTEYYIKLYTANLLSETDFETNCKSYVKSNGDVIEHTYTKNDSDILSPRVSQSIVMKWLRENGIILNIRCTYTDLLNINGNKLRYVVDIADMNQDKWISNDIEEKTYEFAVEKAIRLVLENKLVK